MENGPVEIVDFPINSMVDLSMAKCDSSPEGNQPFQIQHRKMQWIIASRRAIALQIQRALQNTLSHGKKNRMFSSIIHLYL